ncbi:hypothetical protein UAJ10_09315 [Nitrospirillum sp. BR 11164]|uniref:hypothetical protein n=1 Tax=Nitrospirillum sp. BR 11164 TaxID=3104324 RepID=UPI002AFDF3AC|nr:hypothetical protein [Nitrospirillum sp. BR 11164]MEA1649216.1 hypothetical protein [Nitrospirillum sp. BR 11164]
MAVSQNTRALPEKTASSQQMEPRGTTRRALLPALAAAAVAVSATSTVMAAPDVQLTHEADAALLDAWNRHARAYRAWRALPDHETDTRSESAAAAAIWEASEAALGEFEALTPYTTAGFALKLRWMFLDLCCLASVERYVYDGEPVDLAQIKADSHDQHLIALTFLSMIEQCEGRTA